HGDRPPNAGRAMPRRSLIQEVLFDREEALKQIATKVFVILSISMGFIVPLQAVSAQGLPPGQLPTLTGEWWQWAMSIPTSVNPLLDATGNNCMVGQRGSIWFLGGVNGGGSAERICSVPEGLPLFFPVINAINANS